MTYGHLKVVDIFITLSGQQIASLEFFCSESHLYTKCQQVKKKLFQKFITNCTYSKSSQKFTFDVCDVTTLNA